VNKSEVEALLSGMVAAGGTVLSICLFAATYCGSPGKVAAEEVVGGVDEVFARVVLRRLGVTSLQCVDDGGVVDVVGAPFARRRALLDVGPRSGVAGRRS
jgi:hypothetical protein